MKSTWQRILLTGLVVGLLAYSLLAGVTITRLETDFGLKFFNGGTVHASDSTTEYDYICDGSNDNIELQAAINALSDEGGTIELAEGGHYNCTAALTITKPINWIGAGCRSTQIVQTTPNLPLFIITNTFGTAEGLHFSDFSCATVSGGGDVFVLNNVHRSTFEDIEIPGCGNRAFYMKGCLLNTFKRVSPSGNLPDLFAGASSINVAGFYLERYLSISCNGNTFIGCVAEGGDYGWYFTDSNSECNNVIMGGVAEGCVVYGVYAYGCTGLQIFGISSEGSGSRICLAGCIDAVIEPSMCDGVDLIATRGVRLGGVIRDLTIDAQSKFVTADSIGLTGLTSFTPSFDIQKARDAGGESSSRGLGVYERGVLINTNCDLEDWTDGLPTGYGNFGSANITKTGSGQSDNTSLNRSYSCDITKNATNTLQGLSFLIPDRFVEQFISIEIMSKNITGAPRIYIYANTGAHTSTLVDLCVDTTNTAYGVAYMLIPGDWNTVYIVVGGYSGNNTSFYFDTFRVWAQYDGG